MQARGEDLRPSGTETSLSLRQLIAATGYDASNTLHQHTLLIRILTRAIFGFIQYGLSSAAGR